MLLLMRQLLVDSASRGVLTSQRRQIIGKETKSKQTLDQASQPDQAQHRLASGARFRQRYVKLRDPVVVFLGIEEHLLNPPAALVLG